VVLGGETVNDEEAAADDLAGAITLIDIGTIPAATDVNAYHLLPNGDQLISFDTTINLPPGGLTAEPGDVVRYDGSNYSLEFDASVNGVPSGVVTDSISVDTNGDLLLSFDTTVPFPDNLTVDDEDLVGFDGMDFSLFFDGSGAGIAPSLDLDGAHYLGNDKLLLSLDGSGTVDGVSFDDEDVLELNLTGGTWELAYDGSTQHTGWPGADLDAVHSVAILIVSVDIKPGSDPNCIKDKNKGRLPIAILASSEYDVTSIDESTILLEGSISPIKSSLNKDVNGDSVPDLVSHFDMADLEGVLADGVTLTITGETTGGQAISGGDIINLAGGSNCF
jgi:hypothetical protein